MKLVLSFLLSLLACYQSHAQTAPPPCGTIFNTSWENEAFYNARTAGITASRTTATPYYVPVVVHVLHIGGAEKVSDSFVTAAIEELNVRFANLPPHVQDGGIDIGIQFCLATLDTAGNPTTGITRDSSLITYMDTYRTTYGLPVTYNLDSVLKTGRSWDTHRYLNIYIVKAPWYNGAAVGGYATLPWAHGMYEDGVVVDVDFLNRDTTLWWGYDIIAHEVGHYLGLYHTFQAACTNGNCLMDNDRVCDTPPDNYTNSSDPLCTMNTCFTDAADTSSNNPFRPISMGGLGEQNDDTWNYMDYSRCNSKFSPGQRTRMQAALTVSRASLLDSVTYVCGFPPPPTGIKIADARQTRLFPNPFADVVTIETESAGRCTLTLINMAGQLIYRQVLNTGTNQLSLSQLPTATYIYVLQNEDGIINTGTVVRE